MSTQEAWIVCYSSGSMTIWFIEPPSYITRQTEVKIIHIRVDPDAGTVEVLDKPASPANPFKPKVQPFLLKDLKDLTEAPKAYRAYQEKHNEKVSENFNEGDAASGNAAGAFSEAYKASPAISDDGWIKWTGNKCPIIDNNVEIEYVIRNGGTYKVRDPIKADWSNDGHEWNLITYRVLSAGGVPRGQPAPPAPEKIYSVNAAFSAYCQMRVSGMTPEMSQKGLVHYAGEFDEFMLQREKRHV